MSKYFDLLEQKLKGKCKIEPDHYRFKGLLGEQRWIKFLTDDDKFLIQTIREIAIPVFVLIDKGKETAIRALDLGNDYEIWLKNEEIVLDSSGTIQHVFGKLIYHNYPLFGKLRLSFSDFKSNSVKDVIDTYELYGLDLAFWVSSISFYTSGNVYINLLLEPLRLVRRGIFFEHKIPQNNNKITIATLLPLFELTLIIAEVFRPYWNTEGIFTNKYSFLDYYERVIFTRICEDNLGKKYKPDTEIKDFGTRIIQMLNFLINDDKFIKKAKEKGYIEKIEQLKTNI